MRDYRPDIDGLRAIAVISVILCHAGFYGFSGGFVGVDVFFVISGYLITQHLCIKLIDGHSLSLLSFYDARFRRLLPALLCMCAVVLAVWALFFLGSAEHTDNLVESTIAALTGRANFYYLRSAGGYFGLASNQMPMLHLWSLGVEEQFYLVWPLLVALCFFDRPSKDRFISRLTFVLGIGGAASLLAAQLAVGSGHTVGAFYSPLNRAWEIAAGALLAVYELRTPRNAHQDQGNGDLATVVAAFALAILLSCVFLFNERTPFPGFSALLPTLSAAAIIFVGRRKYKFSKVFSNRLMVHLGLVSYGFYLWHWPLLALSRFALLGESPPLLMRIGAIIISYLLALASLKIIEQPFRQKKNLASFRPATVLLTGLAGIGLIATTAFLLRPLEDKKMAEFSQITDQIAQRPSPSSQCDGDFEPVRTGLCTHSFGKPGSADQLFVWGNSHALALWPMVETVGQTIDFKATLAAQGGIPGLFYSEKLAEKNKIVRSGYKFHKKMIEVIKQTAKHVPSGHFSVLLASRWTQYSCLPRISIASNKVECLDENNSPSGTRELLQNSLDETLAQLQAAGVARVLIVLPYPEFRHEVSRCVGRNASVCETPRSQMELYRQPYVDMINTMKKKYANVRSIDPVEILCTKEVCAEISNSQINVAMPIVYDDNHPSVCTAATLGLSYANDLRWLVTGK